MSASATITSRQAEVAAMFARHGPSYRAWAVVTVMLGTVSAVMEATIVNVAMPEITPVFQIGHDRVQLLSTGFLAATTASMLLSHWAIQRYGIRATYIVALCLLMLFSVLASLTGIDQFALLAACRIAQGIIAGLLQPLAMRVIVDLLLGLSSGVTRFSPLALFIEWRQRAYELPAGAGEHLRESQGFSEGFFIIALVYALALMPAWRMAPGPSPRALSS